MKWQAFIVLFVIALSMVVPSSLPFAQTTIGTLDVCDANTPDLSDNGDMPCVIEGPSRHLPLFECNNTDIYTPPFKLPFIAFQDERPPKN